MPRFHSDRRLPIRLPRENAQELVAVAKRRRGAACDLVDHTAKLGPTSQLAATLVHPDHERLHRAERSRDGVRAGLEPA